MTAPEKDITIRDLANPGPSTGDDCDLSQHIRSQPDQYRAALESMLLSGSTGTLPDGNRLMALLEVGAGGQRDVQAPRPLPAPGDARDGRVPLPLPAPGEVSLPKGVPGLLDALPASKWWDMQAIHSQDWNGSLVRQFRDGHAIAVIGQPPGRVLVDNGVTLKEFQLDQSGHVQRAVETHKITGAVRERNDYSGGMLDGYGSVHRPDGTIERRNGLVSPNEKAYVAGLSRGFPERWALPPQFCGFPTGPAPFQQWRPLAANPQGIPQFNQNGFHNGGLKPYYQNQAGRRPGYVRA